VHSHLSIANTLLNRIVQAVQKSDSERAIHLLKKYPKWLSATDEMALNLRAGVLYYAIQYSCAPLVAFALSFAASPDIHFYRLYGSTPIAMAIDKNAKDMIPLLYPKCNKKFALHAAVESRQQLVVAALREKFSFSPKLLQHLGLQS